MAPIELVNSKVFVEEMRYCAGLSTKDEACKALIPSLNTALANAKNKFDLGATTYLDVAEAIRKLSLTEATCGMK